jgi:hypothetical protein
MPKDPPSLDEGATETDRQGDCKSPPVPSHQTTPPPLWRSLQDSAYTLPHGAISSSREGGGLFHSKTLWEDMGPLYLIPEGRASRPRRGDWPQHPIYMERFMRSALRPWTQILNDESVFGITARASLHVVASKPRHGPLELASHSRSGGSSLCPSRVARNMATLLTACLHPTGGGLEIWSQNQISTSLSTRIPIQRDEDGCPVDPQYYS